MSHPFQCLSPRQDFRQRYSAADFAGRILCTGIISVLVATAAEADTISWQEPSRPKESARAERIAKIARGEPAATRENKASFRSASWGMSPAEVKSSESAVFREAKDGWMIFSDREAGIPVQIFYLFSDEKLVGGFYLFESWHRNSNKYLSEFSRLKTFLEKQYGSPQRSSDLFKDDPRYWGAALDTGILSRQVTWETPSTTILLRLDKDNSGANLAAIYVQNGRLDVVHQHLRRETSKSEF